MRWDDPQILKLIDFALCEDIGDGDVTTDACVASDAIASGFFLPQQSLTLAGTPLIGQLYGNRNIQLLHAEGESLHKGQVLCPGSRPRAAIAQFGAHRLESVAADMRNRDADTTLCGRDSRHRVRSP